MTPETPETLETPEVDDLEAKLKALDDAERAINRAYSTGKAERAKITQAAQLDAAEAVAMAGIAMEADVEADEAMRISVIAEKSGDREKAKAVVAELKAMKLKEAAKKVEDGIEETLTYYAFPSEHWLKIRTNNMLERLNREIRRRTRVVGTFPDGESALMLVCARLRHVTGTQWGVKRYMSMKSLEQMDREKRGADCCDLA